MLEKRARARLKSNPLYFLSEYETKPFTESQIVSIIQEQEAGARFMDICREHGIIDATFYNRKAKYGGMATSQFKRLKEIEEENASLKRM